MKTGSWTAISAPALIATTILRPILPAFVQAWKVAVELRLPQPLVDIVMSLTQPSAQPEPPTDVRRVVLHIIVQMRCAVRTRI